MIISTDKLGEMTDLADELYDDGGRPFDIVMMVIAELGIRVSENAPIESC